MTKRKSTRKKVVKAKKPLTISLADRLYGENGFVQTTEDELIRLRRIANTLEGQRDAAIQTLINRANVKKAAASLDQVVKEVGASIKDLRRLALHLSVTYEMVKQAEGTSRAEEEV